MSPLQRQVSDLFHRSYGRRSANCYNFVVFVFFEHLITIDHEIDFFWKHKFSGAAALFFANRYLIFAFSVISLVTFLDTAVTDEVSLNDLCPGLDSTWS